MTEAARYNLQRGIPEDRRYPWTDYSPESPLDNWILSKVKITEEIMDKREINAMAKATAADAAKELEELVNKELEKLLKDFK